MSRQYSKQIRIFCAITKQTLTYFKSFSFTDTYNLTWKPNTLCNYLSRLRSNIRQRVQMRSISINNKTTCNGPQKIVSTIFKWEQKVSYVFTDPIDPNNFGKFRYPPKCANQFNSLWLHTELMNTSWFWPMAKCLERDDSAFSFSACRKSSLFGLFRQFFPMI